MNANDIKLDRLAKRERTYYIIGDRDHKEIDEGGYAYLHGKYGFVNNNYGFRNGMVILNVYKVGSGGIEEKYSYQEPVNRYKGYTKREIDFIKGSKLKSVEIARKLGRPIDSIRVIRSKK